MTDLFEASAGNLGPAYWLLHADGASVGNPGAGGAGAVLYDPNGAIHREVSQYLGPRVTNNEAEYQALLLGLKAALEEGVEFLRIRLDSELIVRQVLGIYKVKNPQLAVYFAELQKLLKGFKHFEIAHVRREFNREADALASAAARSAKRVTKYE